ncbi:hypothetical protein [Promicromonospora sukumoe]|uniref:hypothetical protein n=1 Tax=Promicromonospora sukumoe TaxID=88382 RepID=UPI000378540B|nr:hypothetical protein [Promicromonospora sukumoe]
MTETAKFYTKARRIPMLVGKLPSGGRIWGGPYTITQVGAGAVVAFALWKTAPLWAQLGGFMNIVVAVGVVVGVVWATGKLPSSGRNPVAFVMDAMNLTSSPGRLSGGQVALPKPRLMTHRVMVVVPGAAAREAQPAQVAQPVRAVVRPAEAVPPTVVRPVPTELLPELTARGPADATFEGRRLDPRPGPQPGQQPGAPPSRRSPADWAAAAATAAADRRNSDLTGVGQLLAGQQKNPPTTPPTTPRED